MSQTLSHVEVFHVSVLGYRPKICPKSSSRIFLRPLSLLLCLDSVRHRDPCSSTVPLFLHLARTRSLDPIPSPSPDCCRIARRSCARPALLGRTTADQAQSRPRDSP